MSRISSLLFFLLLVNPIDAFEIGSSLELGNANDGTHYSITECALLETALEYLAQVFNLTTIPSMNTTETGNCQATSILDRITTELAKLKIDRQRLSMAIDTIIRNNINRDFLEAHRPDVHFHSEEFDGGALLISQRFDATITSIKDTDYEKARESFGALLHTVQDFYSHSNWIELGYREPNNGMGKYEMLGIYAWRGMHTCINCQNDTCRDNIIPTILEHIILTSGYFATQAQLEQQPPNVPYKPIGKCSHGGRHDGTVSMDASGGGINKDTSTSDHGHLHRLAASVAYNATRKILQDLWLNISDVAFGEFLGLAATLRNRSIGSLIIVMDDTGSMGPYIDMAKQIARNIVDTYKDLEYPPNNYILSPFNDPTWGPLTISSTPEQFLVELSQLYPHDGGDEPELFYHGVVEALKVCEVGSALYAFTDAPAKDAYLKSQAIQLAKEKRTSITLFYAMPNVRQTGNQSAGKRSTDIIENLHIIDGDDITSVTGGVLMGIDIQAGNATTDFILNNLHSDQLVTILFQRGSNMEITFDIDSSVKQFRIEVASTDILSSTNIRLIRPSGTVFVPTPVAQSLFLHLYNIDIDVDDIGRWQLSSQVNTEHSIHVSAKSDVKCATTIQREVSGTISNLNFVTLTSQPIVGDKTLVLVTVCEKLTSSINSALIDLIDAKSGSAILAKLSPYQLSMNGFLTKISVPNENFRISTIVALENNMKIQRANKEVITPTLISLTINDQPYTVLQGNTLAINYTIFNHGSTEANINLQATDTMDFLSENGLTATYNLEHFSNISDTLTMHASKLSDVNATGPVITNTVIFSISTADYKYDQKFSVYIVREIIPLKNQTEYQKPSEPNILMSSSTISTTYDSSSTTASGGEAVAMLPQALILVGTMVSTSFFSYFNK